MIGAGAKVLGPIVVGEGAKRLLARAAEFGLERQKTLFLHSLMLSSVPPVPGREAVVASRQKPATGKLMLGPSCGSKAAFGGAIFGSSPRNNIYIRFGLSAKTLSPAP